MRFSTWLIKFSLAVAVRCVLNTHELRLAWKGGRSPEEMANLNDKLYEEYYEVYQDENECLAA